MFGIPTRHIARYSEILSVLIRHGLGYLFISGNLMPMQDENLAILGVRLRNACSELGPAFIKLGQLVSTRSDLFPQPIVQELAKLQNQVPPLAFRDIRRAAEESLKSSLESVYQEFEPVPLASASIGQVHYAVLHTGEKVAVKVQRPFLREIVQTDLEIFQVLINQIEQRSPWGKRYPIRTLFEEFSNTIKGELNFLNEGQNADNISKLYRRNSDILVPKIYWEITNPTVLTMEYIPGIPLNKIIGSKGPAYNVHRIADRLSKAILQQILLEGCFHADPHPGNVLILPGDKIAFIDFGITGCLSRSMRGQILSLVSALIRENDDLLLKILSQMGIVPESVDRASFQADISSFRYTHFKVSSAKFSIGESIQDFFNIISRHGIYIPSEFFLVGKSLLTLEGVLSVLDPTLSLAEQAKFFSRGFIREKFGLKSLWERIWGFV
jgi:Predicted unusual protein kinase